MAKISRAIQKIFGSTAAGDEIAQIGSLRAGSINYTTDLVVMQALAQYDSGLNGIVHVTKFIPALEDINAMYFMCTTQLAYAFQEGIPEYDATTEYHIGSIAKDVGTPDLYRSIANTNTGNALSDTSKWLPYNTEGQIPPGGYQAVAIGMTGAADDAYMIAHGFAKCDGTTPASQGVVSPAIAAAMPNMNAGAFIRGNVAAWTSGGASGGADTYDIQHSHTVNDHTHSITSPTGNAAPTTNAGSAHSHGVGTLKFSTGFNNGAGDLAAFYMYRNNGTEALVVSNTSTIPGTETAIYRADVNSEDVIYYTKNGTGSTANESSHTHTTPNHSHTITSPTGGTTPGTDNQLSAAQSILPTYFNAVMYMRVR